MILAACSGGSNDNDAGSDAASDVQQMSDTGVDASPQDSGGQDVATNDASNDASAQDTGTTETGSDAAAPVNGCTAFTDDTSVTTPTITGPSGGSPSQYTPNCVHIKVGQSVTWNVDFSGHPLEAFGGTTPSPIMPTSSGTTVTFTFSSAGTFGFHCEFHPSIMFGAVEVTP
jgi:plastocyanin